MAHTEAHRRRRGRGKMRHELEKAAGIRLGIGERPANGDLIEMTERVLEAQGFSRSANIVIIGRRPTVG